MLKKSYGGLDLDQLVVIAPYREIIQESRYLVIDEQIVDGCIYSEHGELIRGEKRIDEESRKFANIVISAYKPDEIFTLDIAKLGVSGDYGVLEINSFCCAGLYNMDLDIVVPAVNTKVISEYNDYYGI
jgi:hypothetical protein